MTIVLLLSLLIGVASGLSVATPIRARAAAVQMMARSPPRKGGFSFGKVGARTKRTESALSENWWLEERQSKSRATPATTPRRSVVAKRPIVSKKPAKVSKTPVKAAKSALSDNWWLEEKQSKSAAPKTGAVGRVHPLGPWPSRGP